MECFRKGIRCAVDFKDELFMNLFKALDVLYIRNGDTPKFLNIFSRLENGKGYPYLKELELLGGNLFDYNGK